MLGMSMPSVMARLSKTSKRRVKHTAWTKVLPNAKKPWDMPTRRCKKAASFSAVSRKNCCVAKESSKSRSPRCAGNSKSLGKRRSRSRRRRWRNASLQRCSSWRKPTRHAGKQEFSRASSQESFSPKPERKLGKLTTPCATPRAGSKVICGRKRIRRLTVYCKTSPMYSTRAQNL